MIRTGSTRAFDPRTNRSRDQQMKNAMHFLRPIFAALAISVGIAGSGWGSGPPVIMVLGDSLSAGYGIEVGEGWVQLLQRRLDERAPGYRVVNASISGDTTRGARARLPEALRRNNPAIVVVELGGNDGLRGLALDETRENLAAIVAAASRHGAQVLLVGMRLPPNYGPAYTGRFEAIFRDISTRFDVPLVPFLLEGVALDPALMQPDGIHPNARAQPALLEVVWPHLASLL